MIAEKTFSNIIQQVQSSNLNFQLKLSPFSAMISLKKTLVKDKLGNIIKPVDTKILGSAANHHEIVKTECVNAVDDCEAIKAENKDIAQNLHSRIKKLLNEKQDLKAIVETKILEIDYLEIPTEH